MSEILLYHGSKEEVVYPEIRITRYTKDFSWGFYCTNNYPQAYRWADRRSADGIVNVYRYIENPDLKILRFPEMSDEWLDFIAKCRAGEAHPYDIVEGPMADDTIWDYVNGFTSGQISREAFWALAKFKHPTHPISILILSRSLFQSCRLFVCTGRFRDGWFLLFYHFISHSSIKIAKNDR